MIPKIIHYCWFGQAPLPPLAEQCIASWKAHMPEWKMKAWTEASLSQALSPLKGGEGCWLDYMPLYVKQAYEARKFAFVSDYVRLWALEQYGGLYMDVDFMVFRPFDDLMDKYPAFAGYEGSKRNPVMQGVIASEAHGAWVTDMLRTYNTRVFIKEDGSLDLMPNTTYFSDRLELQGFIADGKEKDFFLRNDEMSRDESLNEPHALNDRTFMLHVYPVHYFCPVLTTGENVKNEETYCEHMGESSWNTNKGWKSRALGLLSPSMRTRLIKLKRKLFG